MGFNTYDLSRPAFIVDPTSIVRSSGRQIDWANVPDRYRSTAVVVTVATGGAAANATAIPVEALSGALMIGTTLDFGGKKFARLSAAAVAGATSLAVDALPTALVAGDNATVAGEGKKRLLAGTVVGEALGNGKVSPRVASTNPAAFIMETPAQEDDRNAALSGYGMMKGGYLYENQLPDAAGTPKVLSNDIKNELNAAGCRFSFEQYGDSRAGV